MQSKIQKFSLIAASIYTLPYVAFAFPDTLTGVIEMFTDIGLKIIPFLGAVAFLIFVWGIAKFIRAAGSEKKLEESKSLIIWGVIGLFVLVSVWGIIAFMRNEFNFGSGAPLIPQIHF